MTIEMQGAQVPMAADQAEATLNVLQKNSESRDQEQPGPPSLYLASSKNLSNQTLHSIAWVEH